MVLDNADDVDIFFPRQSRKQESKFERSAGTSRPLAAYIPISHVSKQRCGSPADGEPQEH